jgi:flagellar FliJ protein
VSLFRLAGLHRLRKVQEDQAAAELAASARTRRLLQRRAERALDGLAGSELSEGDVLAWQASVAARAAHTAAVVAARANAAAAEEEERAAAAAWTRARQRSATIDKLAVRHDEAVRAEDDRVEQRALDELATRRAVDAEAGPP